jgi:hypothetical protein
LAITTEREYPLLHLPRGSIREVLSDDLLELVHTFEPLDFDPGHKAKAWLEVNVSAGVLPLDTYLVLSEDERKLLGFFVLEVLEVRVAPGDVPIMQVRGKIKDPTTAQRAVKLVWIARSTSSSAGLGVELFEHALALAIEAGGCALLVEPYDDATAKRLWLKHFELREPRLGGDEEWACLWHTLGTPNQDWQ